VGGKPLSQPAIFPTGAGLLKGNYMKRRSILIALLIGTLGWTLAAQITDSTRDRSTWTWINQDGDQKIEVKVEHKVEFNDDYSDVANIPGDGALKIYDSRGSHRFRLWITRGAAGELTRDYSVDGQARTLDAAGREWLRGVLLQAARQGGLDARNRVQRILKRSGPRGLAEEISHLKGDYVRRIYFEEFLQAPGVSNVELKSAIRNASQTIESDYERAQMLLQIGRVFLAENDLIPEYFAALDKMSSDYERRRTLSGLLKREQLNKEALAAMAQSGRGLKSDYEKAVFLIQATERFSQDGSLRPVWFSAINTIESDYEHHRVLTAIIKVPNLSAETLVDVMTSAARLESDYEKASFLIEAINRYQSDARLRAALVNVAKTISSEYERGRVQKRLDRADF
jgi:hypothetical protein